MITIKAQSSPANATRYFSEHLSHDDYYSEKEQTAGQWFGETGKPFGIESGSRVQKEQFTALCKGLRPDNQTKLTQRTVANRRCLFDLTFSAPKSVSVMALVAQDARLIAAHERAVTAALAAAEKLAGARVRQGAAVGTRQKRTTANIIAAKFSHRESRALDPQLHTHCIVFNVTHDPVEGRLKALEARPIYDHAKQLTQTYRAYLNNSLRELGYQTYWDAHGCPQIRGVDKTILELYSKRSSQRDTLISLRAQQLGRKLSNNEVAEIVHRHRAKKQRHAEPEAVRAYQLEQLPANGQLRLEKLKEQAMAGPRKPILLPPGPAINWVSAIRLAMLASRAVDHLDPFLFSPHHSLPDRALSAAKFIRHVQRTQTYLRRSQQTRTQDYSR